MRKIFYSIGIFLFLGVLSLAYYQSYQIAATRDRLWLLSQTDVSGNSENQHTSFSEKAPGTAVMADSNGETGQYGTYYLKEQDGYVTVYHSDQRTIYETTSISVLSLPESLRNEVSNGKYLRDQQELYSFLENYSS